MPGSPSDSKAQLVGCALDAAKSVPSKVVREKIAVKLMNHTNCETAYSKPSVETSQVSPLATDTESKLAGSANHCTSRSKNVQLNGKMELAGDNNIGGDNTVMDASDSTKEMMKHAEPQQPTEETSRVFEVGNQSGTGVKSLVMSPDENSQFSGDDLDAIVNGKYLRIDVQECGGICDSHKKQD